jgi:AAA15 family ATPase/GTPase
MAALDQVTLKRFKSTRELKDFKLEKLNVLVGAPDPERRTREMI